MKKLIFLSLLVSFSACLLAQNTTTTKENERVELIEDNIPKAAPAPEKIFHNVLRFKPMATIIAAGLFGYFELGLHYARYLTPKVAIPVEFDIFGRTGVGVGFTLLTGIEAVPLTHRQKSGLYLNGLLGMGIFEGAYFIANPNIGYQLVSKKGFVFNANIGPMYSSSINKVTFRWTLDFGFAF